MFCTQCGTRINQGERFCTKCGTRAPEPPQATGAVVKPIAPAEPDMSTSSNAVSPAGSLNSSGVMPAAAPAREEAPASVPAAAAAPAPAPEPPFKMFGVEMGEAPHSAAAPPPLAPSSGDVASPISRTSSGLGAAFWFGAFLLVILGTVAFLGWKMYSSRSGRVSVRVDPPSVQMKAGASTTLSATVAGDPDNSVTWSVMEGAGAGFVRSTGVTASGGKVAASADYLAPLKPGTYHVLATSTKDQKQASSAEIVVTP